MSKQTKITIILDQPMFGDFTESIGRELLEQRRCFGVYSSFSQDRVTFEEIDSDAPERYTEEQKDKINKFFNRNKFPPLSIAIVNDGPDNLRVIDPTKPRLYFPKCRDAGQCTGICPMCYDLLDKD